MRSPAPTWTLIQLALLGSRLPLKVTVPSMISEAAWIPTKLRTGASSMVPFTRRPRALELSLWSGMSDLQMKLLHQAGQVEGVHVVGEVVLVALEEVVGPVVVVVTQVMPQ